MLLQKKVVGKVEAKNVLAPVGRMTCAVERGLCAT